MSEINNTNGDGSEEETQNGFEEGLEEEWEKEQEKSEMIQRKIDDSKVEGWNLKSEQGDRAIMVKPNYGSLAGHFVIALLSVWWSFGIVNAMYAGWKYFTDSDKKVLRV